MLQLTTQATTTQLVTLSKQSSTAGTFIHSTLLNSLPCLAHVLNLTITDFMSVITRIANVEMTSAIWEFDPTLPSSRVLGDSLDVVATICTLTIKIQASGQRIAYCEHLQTECSFSKQRKLPLHSNVRWGTADGMLGRSYELRQVC